MERVFDRIRISGLTLKPSKCKLFRTKAKILRVIVSDGEVSEDPSRPEKIRQWKFNRTPREMHGLLHYAKFGRDFYENFSAFTMRLTDCLKKHSKVECNSKITRAFEAIKEIMASPRVLTSFDPNAKPVVEVDCSAYAIGAALKN
jgi:hypothetical protein